MRVCAIESIGTMPALPGENVVETGTIIVAVEWNSRTCLSVIPIASCRHTGAMISRFYTCPEAALSILASGVGAHALP